MAKVPYMPLYIGDWLQDMDSVSLECESAWLRIVFKMFKDNKSGLYKSNAKRLQRLWKCDANTMQSIIEELKLENIGEVIEENGLYVFKNRRMIKNQDVSKKRTEAAKKRWNKEETECKSSPKDIQNPENEIEYENEIDFELNLKGVRIHDDLHWGVIWNQPEWKSKALKLHGIAEDQLSALFEKFKMKKQASTNALERLPVSQILDHFNNWADKQDKGGKSDNLDLSKI